MLIYIKIIKIINLKNLLIYDNFILINVKIKKKKKNVFYRTDTRTTQNYSSEPHKIKIRSKIKSSKMYK
jgi:hypothetical protein